MSTQQYLGGGFNSYLGKIPILTDIFQMGWFNHQLDMSQKLDTRPKNHSETSNKI